MATSANKKFKVLIVDDSAFMRKVLETIIAGDDQLQVSARPKTAAKQSLSLNRSSPTHHYGHQHAPRRWPASHRADHDQQPAAHRHRQFRIAEGASSTLKLSSSAL